MQKLSAYEVTGAHFFYNPFGRFSQMGVKNISLPQIILTYG